MANSLHRIEKKDNKREVEREVGRKEGRKDIYYYISLTNIIGRKTPSAENRWISFMNF